jgi:hypothetical protein
MLFRPVVDWHYRNLLVVGFLFVLFLLSDMRVGPERGVQCWHRDYRVFKAPLVTAGE